MGKPTGSWPFVRLIIALRACPDLKKTGAQMPMGGRPGVTVIIKKTE